VSSNCGGLKSGLSIHKTAKNTFNFKHSTKTENLKKIAKQQKIGLSPLRTVA